jgi:hypothetical protein
MILVLDSCCKRYGVLPTDLMNRGSSLDMHVADIGYQFESWCQKEAETKSRRPMSQKSLPVTPDLTTEQMKQMIERVRKVPQNDS